MHYSVGWWDKKDKTIDKKCSYSGVMLKASRNKCVFNDRRNEKGNSDYFIQTVVTLSLYRVSKSNRLKKESRVSYM